MGRNRLRVLVLGGTKFLGRPVVESALQRGHQVTLFNRSQTNPELFPEAEKLRGNRDGDLRALEGRTRDVVVDPSGFVPRVVRAGAELLAANGVEHYVFVSSISAYADFGRGYQESATLAELSDQRGCRPRPGCAQGRLRASRRGHVSGSLGPHPGRRYRRTARPTGRFT
jgi:nucleoside-diphosphate-sugar epimerase